MQTACDTSDIGPIVCSIVSLGKSVDISFRTQRLLEQRGHKNDLTTTMPCRPGLLADNFSSWQTHMACLLKFCCRAATTCLDFATQSLDVQRIKKSYDLQIKTAVEHVGSYFRSSNHQWVKHVNKLKHLDGSTKPSREMLNITNPQWPSLKLVGHGQSFHGVADEKIPGYGEMYRMLCL